MISRYLLSLVVSERRCPYGATLLLLSFQIVAAVVGLIFSTVYAVLSFCLKSWSFDYLLVHSAVTFLYFLVFYPCSCSIRRSVKRTGNFVYLSKTRVFHFLPFLVLAAGIVIQSFARVLVKRCIPLAHFYNISLACILAVELFCCCVFHCLYINREGVTREHSARKPESDAARLIRTTMDPHYGLDEHNDCLCNSLIDTQWILIDYLRRRSNNLVGASVAVN